MTTQDSNHVSNTLKRIKELCPFSTSSLTFFAQIRNGNVKRLLVSRSKAGTITDIEELERVDLFGFMATSRVGEGDCDVTFYPSANDVIEDIEKRYGRILAIDEILADLETEK